MNVFEFMESLAQKVSGTYDSGQAFDATGAPCLSDGQLQPSVTGIKDGIAFLFKSITHGELQIEIYRECNVKILIKPQKGINNFLDSIKLLPEIKIHDENFDKDYIIQNCQVPEAVNWLTSEVCSMIRSFGSIVNFKVNKKSFYLLKNYDPETYSIDDADMDLDNLIKVSDLMIK